MFKLMWILLCAQWLIKASLSVRPCWCTWVSPGGWSTCERRGRSSLLLWRVEWWPADSSSPGWGCGRSLSGRLSCDRSHDIWKEEKSCLFFFFWKVKILMSVRAFFPLFEIEDYCESKKQWNTANECKKFTPKDLGAGLGLGLILAYQWVPLPKA